MQHINSDGVIKREEKEKALAQVEASETFVRQEQLKAFLRFICESEMAGRGDDLHEYLIGTEVFGQPTGYSTAENPIVRNRAHSLRRKLQDFYSIEAPECEVRIEIPKGSYCPRFFHSSSREGISGFGQEEAAEIAPPVIASSKLSRKAQIFIAIAVAACLVSGAVGYWLAARRPDPAIGSAIREAWGPLLDRNAHTMICIATAPQLLVRAMPNESVGEYKPAPKELNLDTWFMQRYVEQPGDRLYVLPYFNGPLWGDASGAIPISRVLTKAGVDVQILPERVQDAFALRDRNVILLGRPENSPAATFFLHGLFYNMKYFTDVHDEEIYFTDPKTGASKELARRNLAVHGLITIIRSSDHDRHTQLVIISGVNGAGSIGAAEFFSSSERMQELKAKLAQDGYKSFPTVCQIVISTEADSFLPFNNSLEAYKVITP